MSNVIDYSQTPLIRHEFSHNKILKLKGQTYNTST
jgi:hypothetical protein